MQARLSRQKTRHIASVMLFVWLFALAASWANACLLQPERPSDHPQPSGLVAAHGTGHEAAVGAGSGTHETAPDQQACASFCDTEQTIVTQAQPAKGDGVAEQSALVAHVVSHWLAFAPERPEVRWRPLAAPPPPGPPVAIAFLRLTL